MGTLYVYVQLHVFVDFYDYVYPHVYFMCLFLLMFGSMCLFIFMFVMAFRFVVVFMFLIMFVFVFVFVSLFVYVSVFVCVWQTDICGNASHGYLCQINVLDILACGRWTYAAMLVISVLVADGHLCLWQKDIYM